MTRYGSPGPGTALAGVLCELCGADAEVHAETISTFLPAFGVVQGKLLFSGLSANGIEPWVTDGTVAGTHELADIVAGAGHSQPSNFVDFNGLTYFVVQQPVTNGIRNEYWRTDGTTAGTVRIENVAAAPISWGARVLTAVIGQQMLFSGSEESTGYELWALDNARPSAIADSGTTTAGVAVTVNVLANDVDADGAIDATTARIVQQPAHGTVVLNAGGAQ